jgi:prepilin-type N-terminal cleavage/methylation domain-containing protein
MSGGFSLIELLVGLCLMGIVLAGAVVSLSDGTAARSVRHAATHVKLELDGAAVAASRLGSPVTVLVEGSLVRSTISYGTIVAEYRMKPAVTSGLQPTLITFHPSGAVSPRSIRLNNRNHSCRVVVSLRGRTRIECP